MARYRPVHVKIWSCDEKFQEYSKDGKLLFLYLITNDHLTESGLYKITYKTMANETDIPKGEIKKLINGELKNNVSYDENKSVAFVHKFLEHNGGGNPKLVKISINKDRTTIKTRLWKEFNKFYSIDLKPLDNPLPKDSAITIPNSNANTKEENMYSIIEHWNSQKIKNLEDRETNIRKKTFSKIQKQLKDYSLKEINEAITNYSIILKEDKYFFSYSWQLWEFLDRGLVNFLTKNNPYKNYISNKEKGITKEDKRKKKLDDWAKKPEEK